MNYKNVLAFTDEKITTVKVRFSNESKTYTYKIYLSDDYQVGDYAVVELHRSNNSSYPYKVVEILSIDDLPDIDINSNIDYKFLVNKVQLSEYQQRTTESLKAEKVIVNESRKALRNSLLSQIKNNTLQIEG